MRHLPMLAAALSLALAGGISPALAQTLDKNGRCHAANGQFAKAEVCKGARGVAPAAAGSVEKASKVAAPAAATGAVYKLDAKGKCRDAKGKMAKKQFCKAA